MSAFRSEITKIYLQFMWLLLDIKIFKTFCLVPLLVRNDKMIVSSVFFCSECVECLLEHNAKVLVYDNVTKRTPLHAAGKDLCIQRHCFVVCSKKNECVSAFL